MVLSGLQQARGELEEKLRSLLGRPVMVIEFDIFALPCGCTGLTANTRGLELDDLEVFHKHILPILKKISEGLNVPPSFIFARLVPGTSIVVALNWRVLCKKCAGELQGKGQAPRPDLYIIHQQSR